MPKYSLYTILVINSATIDLFVVEKNKNYTHFVHNKQTPYSGFENYSFVDAKQLFTLVQQIFSQCEDTLGFSLNNFSVILPQRFFRVSTKERTKLLKGKAVTAKDNKKLLNSFFMADSGFKAVNLLPKFYMVDGERFLQPPIGVSGDNYLINIEQLALENSIEELFSTCAKSMNKQVKFFASSSLVANQYMLENLVERSIWIDFNQKTTDISLCENNQILLTKTVDWGGDFVFLSFAELLNIEVDIAKKLVSKLNFNLPLTSNNNYVLGDREQHKFDQAEVNKHAITTLYFIIKQINDVIMTMTSGAKLPIYFFGNEICNCIGIREILEDFTETDVKVLLHNKINQTRIDIVTDSLLNILG